MAALTDQQLSELLLRAWATVLGREVGPDEDFFALGGSSIQAAMISNRVQAELGVAVNPAALFGAPTIAALVAWFHAEHPRLFTVGPTPVVEAVTPTSLAAAHELLRVRLASPQLRVDEVSPRNPPAIFILCPPRSGSTLLRAMLAGHPELFAPPELYLLGFDTLAQRQARLSAQAGFLGEGLIRALMALDGASRAAAEALVEALVERDASTHEVYALLQGKAAPRRLVDKTPPYAFTSAALRRAEVEFEDALFIHLVRHPQACVESFVEARVDLAIAEPEPGLPRSGRARGELWWLVAQQNILAFLATIPPQRQCRVRFEELVRAPEAVARGLCDRLGLGFCPAMLEPHAEPSARMTDGLAPGGMMIGDRKFHLHDRIDPRVADRWREQGGAGALSEHSWAIAEQLGYPREHADAREEWVF